MRRSVLLALSVALAVLVFAPVAAAQMDDNRMDERGMDARGADGFDDRGMDDRGFDDDVMASPTASVSATASAMGSTSASTASSASATSSTSPSASASAEMLPDTGGTPLMPLLSAAVLILLVGSGIVAIPLMRRTS